jgi:hypothetical protein
LFFFKFLLNLFIILKFLAEWWENYQRKYPNVKLLQKLENKHSVFFGQNISSSTLQSIFETFNFFERQIFNCFQKSKINILCFGILLNLNSIQNSIGLQDKTNNSPGSSTSWVSDELSFIIYIGHFCGMKSLSFSSMTYTCDCIILDFGLIYEKMSK